MRTYDRIVKFQRHRQDAGSTLDLLENYSQITKTPSQQRGVASTKQDQVKIIPKSQVKIKERDPARDKQAPTGTIQLHYPSHSMQLLAQPTTSSTQKKGIISTRYEEKRGSTPSQRPLNMFKDSAVSAQLRATAGSQQSVNTVLGPRAGK